MYFKINIDKDEFEMSQEEYEFHQRIIRQFKNEYDYAFKYLQHDTPNIIIELNYFTENRKFEFVGISNLKYIHDTLVRTDYKIKKWFYQN